MMAVHWKELDKLAVAQAIERSPFNSHEKSVAATHRRMLAILFTDGYRRAEQASAAEIDRLRRVVTEYCKLEEALLDLADSWDKVCLPHAICVTHARELRKLLGAALADGEGVGK